MSKYLALSLSRSVLLKSNVACSITHALVPGGALVLPLAASPASNFLRLHALQSLERFPSLGVRWNSVKGLASLQSTQTLASTCPSGPIMSLGLLFAMKC